MKYYSFIIVLSFTFGCQKEMNNNNSLSSSISKKEQPSFLDTIANSNWVFTEYHDKATQQRSTSYMVIMSDGNETANIDFNGNIFLNRDCDFDFAPIDYFNSLFHNVSFVTTSYSGKYYDTANYKLVDRTITLTKPIKYLPDTMSILVADTACLVLSGKLHPNGYEVNRTIVLYKNTRWYGGYRNYAGL